MPSAKGPHPPPATACTHSYFDYPESHILPDSSVSGEAAELPAEFVHPHQHAPEETLVGSSEGKDDDETDSKAHRSQWKRPSPWWLMVSLPFTAIAVASTIAGRIEIFTRLVCSVYKPDTFKQNYSGVDASWIDLSAPNLAAASPSPTLIPIYLAGLIMEPLKTGDKTTFSNQCASDPVVQAEVAKLAAVIATTNGVLSCITTGWWGSFSDRHGRTRVIGISVLGQLANDFAFIAVTTFWKYLPGGYWLLVIGPVVEGFLGGLATGMGAINGYMADTTIEGRRTQMFSTGLGLTYTGMALGPMLGSLLIHFTGKTISVIYLATTIHLIFAFFVWNVLPESLSDQRRRESKAKYAAEKTDMAAESEPNPAIAFFVKSRRLFTFFSPLTIFMPVVEKAPRTNSLKAPKKDWTLTIIALGYASIEILGGSYGVDFQYAASTFKWNSEIMGYLLSFGGTTRAIFLAVILPLSIKLFKPKPVIIEVPRAPTETTPLVGASADSAPGSVAAPTTAATKKEVRSPAFDLNLARVSLFFSLLSYLGMGLARPSQLFILFSDIFGAFGVGFAPAVQSVMLALYSRRGETEIGRLFGALSVLHILCSRIFGPILYGVVYMKTVAYCPATIFFVSAGGVAISLVMLGFVRLPSIGAARCADIGDEEGALLGAGTGGANGTLHARAHAR